MQNKANIEKNKALPTKTTVLRKAPFYKIKRTY